MIDSKKITDLFIKPSIDKVKIELFIKDYALPLKLQWNEGCRYLLVSFHGAVNRVTRVPPVFSPFIPEIGQNFAQLSMSDPLMLKDGEYGMTWYAGSEDLPLQNIYADIFKSIADSGKFDRIVFYGSSGGGFASLYYSSLIPGSISVPIVPQTNILKYYSGHIKRYMDGCWPSLKTVQELQSRICTDLCEWYTIERPNTVIYLQSPADHFHTREHFAPFLSKISRVSKARFIINSDFWGVLGHSRAVPISIIKTWLQAACLSPTIEVDDLLEAYLDLKLKSEKLATNRPLSSGVEHGSDDIRVANFLRDFHCCN